MQYYELPELLFRQARALYFTREAPSLRSPETAAYALSTLAPFLDDVPLSRIYHDCPELIRWRDSLRNRGITAGTINRKIDVLRRVMALAARKWRDEEGRPYLLSTPLLPHVKGSQKAPYIVSMQEQSRLLEELSRGLEPYLADAVLFAVNTGLRSGEQVALRWDWITDDGKGLVLPFNVTKTLKSRYVPLNRVARGVLKRLAGRHDTYVFSYRKEPIVRRFNNHAFRRARARAGVPCRWHNLRHTFASRLDATGAPLTDIAAILGHAVPGFDMTRHYSQPDKARLLRRVEKLPLTPRGARGTVRGVEARRPRKRESAPSKGKGRSAGAGGRR